MTSCCSFPLNFSVRRSYRSGVSRRVSLSHSVAVISITKSMPGGRFCFVSLPLPIVGPSPSLREVRTGTQGRNLEWKSRKNTTYCLVLSFIFSYISYTTRDHLPRDDLTRSGLSPPTQTSSPGNPPCTHPQARLTEAILLLKVPLPRCVNLTTKISITETRLGL